MSLWVSFCYRIYQEMVRPLFRKCCPKKQNKIDIESNESQTIPALQNESQSDHGPKRNPLKCSAFVQVTLAETVNDVVNDVMDELMEFVRSISQEQLTRTVNNQLPGITSYKRNNQLPAVNRIVVNPNLPPLKNTAKDINVELKRRIHHKIFYLGDEILTTIADQTTVRTVGCQTPVRTTTGSTQTEPESDERDSVFALLSKTINDLLHNLCSY